MTVQYEQPSTLLEDSAAAAEGATESNSRTPEPSPRRKSTSRVILNFWLDALLLVNVVVIGWVSAILQIAFPAPTVADGWKLWGLTFDQWRDIQSTALCCCGLLALEHLVLHWNWVCCTITTRILRVNTRPDEGVQALYGIGTFIAIITFVLCSVIFAMMCIQRPV